jgi:hypothetical protein
MARSLLLSGMSAFTRDLALPFVVHRSKSTIRSILFCHDPYLLNIYGLERFVKSVIASETFVTNIVKSRAKSSFSTSIGGHCAVRLTS